MAAVATAAAINREFMKTILRLFWRGSWTGGGSGSSRPISKKDAPACAHKALATVTQIGLNAPAKGPGDTGSGS
jgi:hypothetical protein